MSRNKLHISKMDKFKQWLDEQGIEHRPGRGAYQILQVKLARGGGYAVVYERDDMPEHYSVDRRLDVLVSRFCKARKREGGEE